MSAETVQDDEELALTGRWYRDKGGIYRISPPAYAERQARLCAALRAVRADPDAVRPDSEYTFEEMRSAESAYRLWLEGRGPELTEAQLQVKRAYKRRRDHGERFTDLERVTPALEETLRMVGCGMSLAAIAEARGVIPKTVAKLLQHHGKTDVLAALRAEAKVATPNG